MNDNWRAARCPNVKMIVFFLAVLLAMLITAADGREADAYTVQREEVETWSLTNASVKNYSWASGGGAAQFRQGSSKAEKILNLNGTITQIDVWGRSKFKAGESNECNPDWRIEYREKQADGSFAPAQTIVQRNFPSNWTQVERTLTGLNIPGDSMLIIKSDCDRKVQEFNFVDVFYTPATSPPLDPTPQNPVNFGAFVGDVRTPDALDSFNSLTGYDYDVVLTFDRFGEYNIDPAKFANAKSRGAILMSTLEPQAEGITLSSISAGQHDAWIQNYADMLVTHGEKVYVRFAHEMNGGWMPWGEQATQYRAAFRHVAGIIHARAPKAEMVFAPNVNLPITPYYPGDAAVDIMALDGYNFGVERPILSARQVFSASYDELAALDPDDPMMIAETASFEYTGKPDWITDLYTDAIPNRMPRIETVVWFNTNKERDWRVNSSPASLETYRGVLR